jgi:2,3,4,5-tetrahydropyridine-2-carboxylate N-succinyltransferase
MSASKNILSSSRKALTFALGRPSSRSFLLRGISCRQHAKFDHVRPASLPVQRKAFYSTEKSSLQHRIEAISQDKTQLATAAGQQAIETAMSQLDDGTLRVCSQENGVWTTHAWVKQAILLYFSLAKMQVMEHEPFTFHDKIPLKKNVQEQGVRIVPPGTVRYGSFLERGCVVMSGYVNIGAYVGAETMVDTWATVGSCAQIGKHVHLSGGVGIGGVLEPAQASPVIVEDGAFIGSRCVVVEGVHVGAGAVLGAGVTLTGSTPIIDVRGPQEVVTKGAVPPRAVVVPGTRAKVFPAGTYNLPCALIIGERTLSTDRKTSLNDVLRRFDVPV